MYSPDFLCDSILSSEASVKILPLAIARVSVSFELYSDFTWANFSIDRKRICFCDDGVYRSLVSRGNIQPTIWAGEFTRHE